MNLEMTCSMARPRAVCFNGSGSVVLTGSFTFMLCEVSMMKSTLSGKTRSAGSEVHTLPVRRSELS